MRQRHQSRTGLVRAYVIRQQSAESAVVMTRDVFLRARDDLRGVGVVDVAGFAVVVPGYDLHVVGEELQRGFPAIVPEGGAGGIPVFGVLGEVWDGLG